MLFQLPSFLVFFGVFCLLLLLCPRRFRQIYVTLASLFFYGWWYPPYVLLLCGMVVGCGLLLRLVWRDKRWLTVAVLLALSPLTLFKYTNFLFGTLSDLTGLVTPRLSWSLPLAISFVTFTMISFLVDTARAPGKAPPRFWQCAVYLTFFPHLIAGPILRARHILPQLPRLRFDWAAVMPNLTLFTVGMLKKVLVADPVGIFIDHSYAAPESLTGWGGLVTVFGFAIEMYCDFSAYSDMAIALAGALGISFPENFHSPYAAVSLGELWRRWHMTLSFWLRDYVFKPLHRRFYKYARYLAIILTMTLSGLWHGAAWTFVLWGLALGLIMAVEQASGYARFAARARGLWKGLCICRTFLIWSFVGVLFRAPDLQTAREVAITSLCHGGWQHWSVGLTLPVVTGAILLLLHPIDQTAKIRAFGERVPLLLLPVLLSVIIACSVTTSFHPKSFQYFVF